MQKIVIKVGNMYSTIHNIPNDPIKIIKNNKKSKKTYTMIDYISDNLSYSIPNAYFISKKYPNWDGKIRLLKKSRATKNKKYDGKFYTGLVYKVIKIIYEITNQLPIIEDLRKRPNKNFNYKWNNQFKIRDYQKKVIDECVKKGRGLINVCTGGGKCCDKNTLISTENGLLPINFFLKSTKEKIKEYEMKIQTDSGIYNTKLIYNDEKNESIEIKTKCGYTISGTKNHKIKILSKNNKANFVKLSNIKIKDKALIYLKNNLFGKVKYDFKKCFSIGENIKNTIPIKILKSNKQCLASFLNGFLSKNKIIYNKKKYYKFNNKKILKQIQIILLQFGIISSFQEIISNNELNYMLKILNYKKHFKNKFYNNIFFIDSIVSIKKKIGHNYDFEIPKIHNFIGNGFVNHNTIIVSKIIQELGVTPFIFYVLTKDLMKQAKKRLEESIPGLQCGLVGDGLCDIKDINIMTIQTTARAFGVVNVAKKISKIDGWSDGELEAIRNEKMDHIKKKKEEIKQLILSAKGIYFDECHYSASKVCEEVITKSLKAFFCFGGTATPNREDNADLVLEGLFGQKRGNITASFLIEQKYLIQPKIYFIKLKEKKIRAETYEQDYTENLVFNQKRNEIIAILAKKSYSLGLSTLILVQRIKHGEILQSMIDKSFFVHGKTNKKKREEILERFEKGDISVLIASTIADEGLDLPILEILILAGGGKSKNRLKQRIGRVVRVNKNKPNKKAYVFDFDDQGYYLAKHSRLRKKSIKSEPKYLVSTVKQVEDIPEFFMQNIL